MPRPDLNNILEMLDEENIAKAVHAPHAFAREQYGLRKITVQSYDEFRTEIGKYYAYQINATSGGGVSMPAWLAEGYAESALNRTFGQIGGAKGACQMAQKGINGGLKFSIDKIFDWIVSEQTEHYLENILTTQISPMSWSDQVEVMRQIQNKFGTPGKPMRNPMELAAEYKEHIRFIAERMQILRTKIRR